MNSALFVALAVALVTCVIAFAREIRLRKVLEKLSHTILSRWRAMFPNLKNSILRTALAIINSDSVEYILAIGAFTDAMNGLRLVRALRIALSA